MGGVGSGASPARRIQEGGSEGIQRMECTREPTRRRDGGLRTPTGGTHPSVMTKGPCTGCGVQARNPVLLNRPRFGTASSSTPGRPYGHVNSPLSVRVALTGSQQPFGTEAGTKTTVPQRTERILIQVHHREPATHVPWRARPCRPDGDGTHPRNT